MTAVVFSEDQFEELIRLFDENPNLRARLRVALVGEELADWSARFARIAELQERNEKWIAEVGDSVRSWVRSMERHSELLRQMDAEAKQRQQEQDARFETLFTRLGERMDQLTARVDSLTQQVQQLTVRMDQLTARVDDLAVRMEQLTARVDSLTQQVQQLTVRMDQLTARVDDLAVRMEQLTARVDDLTQQMQQLTSRVEQLTVDTQRLTGELGKVKGWQLEQRYFTRAPAYFAPILRRIHALSPEELGELLDALETSGQLSEAEVREIQNADVVVRGRARDTGEERYLLVEVSVGVGLEDVERAVRRAKLLSRALNVPVLPVVAGEYFRAEAIRAANEQGVWKVLDGACEPPQPNGNNK